MEIKNDMLNQLHEFVIKYGKIPNAFDFHKKSDDVIYTTYGIKKLFGGWNKYLESGGYTVKCNRDSKKMSDHEVAELLKQQLLDYYNEHNELPELRTFNNNKGYKWTKHVILSVFGTWNNYLKYCGFDAYSSGARLDYRDNNKLLELLRNAIESTNSLDRDILHATGIPSRPTYVGKFGSWQNAIRLCGYDLRSFKYSTPSVADDGHDCDSVGEAIIDNWLYKRNIPHELHVKYKVDGSNCSTCDFVVGNVYIEYTESQYIDRISRKYIDKLDKKRIWCNQLGVKLVEIDSKTKIDSILYDTFITNQAELKPCELLEP